MAKQKKSSIPKSNGAPNKMDLALRKFMLMTDTQIKSALSTYKKNAITLQTSRITERLSMSKATKSPKAKKEHPLVAMQVPRHLSSIEIDGAKPLCTRAILRYSGNKNDLTAMGIQVKAQAQDVFTISATRKQLEKLALQPACRRIRSPRILYPNVEQASAQNEVAAVHDPRPLNPTGFQGNGVLVGVIDSALDVTHHGFRDPQGTHDSRVLYYWAQSTYTIVGGSLVNQANPPGQTPDQFTAANPGTRPNFTGLTYGRIYTNASINTAIGLASPYGTGANQICCEPKNKEHGTHCTGIAAGSGHVNNWATNPTHIGAAPRATIVYVSLQVIWNNLLAIDTDATLEDALIDAIDFCMRVAQFHAMPISISVSQGSNWGPHNGSTDFDVARDNFLNSFDLRSIAFSAGNDNDENGYRTGTVAQSSTETFTWRNVRDNNVPCWLDIWYTGPELDYRIAFSGANSGWRMAGQDYQGIVNGRTIEAERDIEPSGGMSGIRFYIEAALLNDQFTIDLRNPNATQRISYHAWAGVQGWWGDLSGSTQNARTLGDTSCGRSILSVGSCDKLIPPNTVSGETIAGYSGAGPTIDGRIKPEIVAVGGTSAHMIVAAKSDQNSGYTSMAGTSMATPLVAGAIALLFEEYGAMGFQLNMDTIKALLIQHANRTNIHVDPSQPGFVAADRNRYGYGRLRMIGPIDEVMAPVDVDLWIRTASDDYGQEPYPGGCFCGAPDIQVFPVGSNTEITQLTWGTTYDVRVTVRNMGDTIAVGATLGLRYTTPHTAPNTWFEAEDDHNQKLVRTISVPAMSQIQETFRWRPESTEVAANPSFPSHFCLLATVDHAADPLTYAIVGGAGGAAWSTNIKGTNNVALKNLHIQ